MRLLSILARVGLVFLGAVLVTAVSADVVWEDSSDYEVTTSDLAEALFGEWALPLLVSIQATTVKSHCKGWSEY